MSDVMPEGESLRQAVRWLAEQEVRDEAAITEAARRFDLSPLDEDFLLRRFVTEKSSANGRPSR
jgi:hypothetical protein